MAASAVVTMEQKRLAASTVLEAECRGPVIAALAKALDRTTRTIRRWAKELRDGTLGAKRAGPDPVPVERDVRQGIYVILLALGSMAQEQLIRRLFPEATFSVIRDMKRRFARVIRCRKRRGKSRLVWTGAGRVWAMDFTKPKAKLPGRKRLLFMVRDLASGNRLASVPCKSENQEVVRKTLCDLFALYGAPLVIKHDGGSAFIAQRTYEMLAEHGVHGMLSPARTPEYNGSIERSLGWDKIRIEQLAENAGHPGVWTAELIERARVQANGTRLPRHLKGLTPDECFALRKPITKKEREAFQRTVSNGISAQLKNETDELGRIITDVPFEVMQRRSITRALVKHGYLKIRRGRISTPFPGSQPDRNS